MSKLDELLGIDRNDPVEELGARLAESHQRLLDDLVELRTQKGLSQRDVADRMGVTQSAVSRFESINGNPTLSSISRYALAIMASVQFVVHDEESKWTKAPIDAATRRRIHSDDGGKKWAIN